MSGIDKLSKEELIALLNKKQTSSAPKERKKANLDEDKKNAMLERLAQMREKVRTNREAKKTALVSGTQKSITDKEVDAIFEKKYGTKFDKMTDMLSELNTNTSEMIKMKKEKLESKKITPVVAPTAVAPTAVAPTAVAPPTDAVVVSVNPYLFSKGRTRF